MGRYKYGCNRARFLQSVEGAIALISIKIDFYTASEGDAIFPTLEFNFFRAGSLPVYWRGRRSIIGGFLRFRAEMKARSARKILDEINIIAYQERHHLILL